MRFNMVKDGVCNGVLLLSTLIALPLTTFLVPPSLLYSIAKPLHV